MKKVFLILVLILTVIVLSGVSVAQNKANVITSKHDIGYDVGPPVVAGSGCLSCHAPHNGSVATGGTDQNTGKLLLWDRGFSTQTFGTYDSATLGATATEIGGGTTPTSAEVRTYSLLCMSCHDGVTTTSLIAATSEFAVGNPTNSAGLSNDHPVNMAYGLGDNMATTAAITTAGLKLYNDGTDDTVQCGSCHNPHDPTNTPFLRKSNTGSGLCITCHL